MTLCEIGFVPEGMAYRMSTIGPAYPAQLIVSQAELKLVADETSSAAAVTIKSDQNRIEAAHRKSRRLPPKQIA